MPHKKFYIFILILAAWATATSAMTVGLVQGEYRRLLAAPTQTSATLTLAQGSMSVGTAPPDSSSAVPSGAGGTAPATTVLTAAVVAGHNSRASYWLIIGGKIYDVTNFLRLHPGGAGEIVPYCGKEATTAFQTQGGGKGGHSNLASTMLTQYYIART